MGVTLQASKWKLRNYVALVYLAAVFDNFLYILAFKYIITFNYNIIYRKVMFTFFSSNWYRISINICRKTSSRNWCRLNTVLLLRDCDSINVFLHLKRITCILFFCFQRFRLKHFEIYCEIVCVLLFGYFCHFLIKVLSDTKVCIDITSVIRSLSSIFILLCAIVVMLSALLSVHNYLYFQKIKHVDKVVWTKNFSIFYDSETL